MPLIQIHAPIPRKMTLPELLAAIRDQGALAFETPPENIWVEFLPVQPGTYLQADQAPLVFIKAKSGREKRLRDALTAAVTKTLASGLSVPPAKIWIHYEEMSPADVWFGGRWDG